jgi:hypothetical protein
MIHVTHLHVARMLNVPMEYARAYQNTLETHMNLVDQNASVIKNVIVIRHV